jgi:tetratricopeptide (TPR) repeat protein/peroxiredoxin
MNFDRRKFLERCCQGAAGSILVRAFPYAFSSSFESARPDFAPASFDPSAADAVAGEFHLHPHYRLPGALDSLLLKTKSGLDEFITEKYADEIAAVLRTWSSGLLNSPHDLAPIKRSFSDGFIGQSFEPPESRVLRSRSPVEIQENTFVSQTPIQAEEFLRQLQSRLSGYTKFLTADFQVTSIDPEPGSESPTLLKTQVLYEFVAAGPNFYREQRAGYWQLTWARSSSGDLRVIQWQPRSETISRSATPVFADITRAALGGNPSYAAQLLHGTDYWRTILDSACGIDVYGHNGVSVGDIDGDGRDDLYICQPAGLPNRLYRNRGDGTFDDITDSAGVGVLENSSCALLLDINNDGRQDLIVVRADGPMLFLNQGDSKFRHQPSAFHFQTPPLGTFTGAAARDYDRDGWIDIYFCLYTYYQGTDQYKYPTPYYAAENGPPNFLMRNNRDGTFEDVTAEAGLNINNTRYSFACAWNDFNRDGWPDLYVANDFGRKNLYRNNGNGTFTDVAADLGVEDVGAGMGVCWLDCENTGFDDLYTANMWAAAGQRITAQDIFQRGAPPQTRELYRKHAMGNSLFRNPSSRNRTTISEAKRKQDSFADLTSAAGVRNGRWSWSCDAFDFDHDGFPDLYIANGMVSGPKVQDAGGLYPSAPREMPTSPVDDLNSFFWRQVVAKSPSDGTPAAAYEQGWSAINELIRADRTWSGYERNVFYASNRDGTFCDISGATGLDFREDGRAFAITDFDHDGRQEILLKNRNAPQVRVLKNVLPGLPPSISFRLRGTKSNRDAIGAIVTLQAESGSQTKSVQAGSGFLSQHSKDLFFGLGLEKRHDEHSEKAVTGGVNISILWPSGLEQKFQNLPINCRITIEEGMDKPDIEEFLQSRSSIPAEPPQPSDLLPTRSESWLLSPILAPDFSAPAMGSLPPSSSSTTFTLSSLRNKTVLLNFGSSESDPWRQDLQTFHRHSTEWNSQGFELVVVCLDSELDPVRSASFKSLPFRILRGTDEVAAIYSILGRLLFDRHRDLTLPTSFLIAPTGEIVKIYQGALDAGRVAFDFLHIPQTIAERMSAALPFRGISDSTGFPRNYLSYGSVYFQRGYMDPAKDAFEAALHGDPSSAEALYGIGSVYLNQQRNADARDCFERALKLQANYPGTLANAWNNLGLLASRDGRIDQAAVDFQQALKLSPDHRIALVNLGNAYRQQKKWDAALHIYERAVQEYPEDPEANYGLGMVLAQQDNTDRAFALLQRALKLRPAYPEALNNLGILYLRTDRRDQAVASFEECIRVAPTFDQAYLNLARVYLIEQTPDKARALLLQLLGKLPANQPARDLLDQLNQSRAPQQ